MSSSEKKALIAAEGICIYCGKPSSNLEHMPPRAMFTKKDRPPGMEFPTCEPCNKNTGMADAVASMLARIPPSGEMLPAVGADFRKLVKGLQNNTPDFMSEILSSAKPHYIRDQSGLLRYAGVSTSPDGPFTKGYLNTFSAKFGMAMYREHVGERLPDHGTVNSAWFLNAGASNEMLEGMLAILPIHGALSQQEKRTDEQFYVRFNTDQKKL